MSNIDNLTESQIIERLNLLTNGSGISASEVTNIDVKNTYDVPQQLAEGEYRKASVLIPFVRQDNAWHIVFIRRAESDKDRHSGQVAFVGGKSEDFDHSEIDTALRETQEEIGINPVDVKVLGKLGFHYSISHFEITPVVAIIPWPYDLTLDPGEVSHTFTLPLAWLADENNHEIRERTLQIGTSESSLKVPVVYFNEYEGELLWGATARMMLSLIETLK